MKIIATLLTVVSIISNGFSQTKSISQQNNMETKKVAFADKIILQMHPEKVLNFLPDLNDQQISNLFGMTLQEYHSAKKVYADQAENAAKELLSNSEFSTQIEKLPFKKNDVIMVIGESTADALNSWVYILQNLLSQKRQQDSIKVLNMAVSGQTTTEALRKITTQLKQKPNWIFCHLGTNDCMRYGNIKTTVTLTETIENLNAIKEIINKNTKAKIIWFSPIQIDEKKVENFPPFKAQQLSLKNLDLIEISKKLKAQSDTVIDLTEKFENPLKLEFMQYDGIHLTIEGQKAIVKSLINKLSNL
jgi:acyl-CoA thioesterase I